MDIFIATKNIENFTAQILTEQNEIQKNVLLELLRREKKKLSVAVAANGLETQPHGILNEIPIAIEVHAGDADLSARLAFALWGNAIALERWENVGGEFQMLG